MPYARPYRARREQLRSRGFERLPRNRDFVHSTASPHPPLPPTRTVRNLNAVEKKFNDEKVYKDENPPKITNPKTKGVRFIPSGYNTIYNENDEIWQDGNFKDGQLYDGKVYVYGSNGLLIKIKVFKEGKFHSLEQL